MAAEFSWTPPLAILALGAVAGAVLVARGHRPKAARSPETGNEAARRADLQREYDALIRRLAEGGTPEERSALEIQAAHVLRRMDTAASAPSPSEGQDRAPSPVAPSRPASAVAGFLYGVLTMAVLGGLIFFASQGSKERSAGGSPTGGMGSGAAPQEVAGPTEAEVATLEDAVRAAPREIGPRIELTRAYLQRRDLMKVFDQTKAILEIEPGNPHALTYQALVRVAMGQAASAETMLVEAIGKDPTIEDAYIHLALARVQLGNQKGAQEAIEQGQQRFPEDKDQLADIFRQITSAADGPAASPAVAEASTAPAAETTTSGAGSASLVVVVDLSKGVVVPSGALLFVIVREAGFETGPPVAVKRLAAADFPITVNISEKDSMAGESLPGLVRIDARIDADGDPLTKDPKDPVASEDNVRTGGGQTLLVLAPGKN